MDMVSSSLADLFHALDRATDHETRGDREAARVASVEVSGHVAHVASLACEPLRTRIEGPPPRQVAIAMAQALFAAPHMARTLALSTTATEVPLVQPTEGLGRALGLPVWQLEEIRAEVDQQVSNFLRRVRTLQWLWTRYDNPRLRPRPLWSVLLPGSSWQAARFERRGGRLYAVGPAEAPPPTSSLYLHWHADTAAWTVDPMATFSARWVDASILRAMSRALGLDLEEAQEMLDHVVAVLPDPGSEAFLWHDRWHSEGWSALTGIGESRTRASWLLAPLAPEAFDDEEVLTPVDGGLALTHVRKAFDREALRRVRVLMNGMYAELCSRAVSEARLPPERQRELYDLGPAIQRVLAPLLRWTEAPETHAHLAARLGVPLAGVTAAMRAVRSRWTQAARTSWGGTPAQGRPHTVQSLLALHLAIAQTSLARVLRLAPDPRGDHRRVAMLFFATYAATTPLTRLWRVEDGRLPKPEDVLGAWFWGTWQRVLASVEAERSVDDVEGV